VASVAISATPESAALVVHALQFREGTLFAYVPGPAAGEFGALLAEPGLGWREPGRRRLPVLSHVAVLATDLQDSVRIWTELPAEEYFELVNQIWVTVDAIFTRHQAAHGKHPGDGMVGYFFPRSDASHLSEALLAAQETREAMRGISKQWQLRKGWAFELYMNTGLDEGQQWLGALRAGGQVEFTMQGAPLNRALRISEFARSGGIWATKNLVARLTPSERERLNFGVRRSQDGHDQFVASTFSTVEHLADAALSRGDRLKDIARLPITEIVTLAATDAPAGAVVAPAPL
jgi:class 3 adenylate cyclase